MDAKTRPRSLRQGKVLGLLAFALSALFAASSARAQSLPDIFPPSVPGYGTDPGVTVQTRARPEFDPLGIRVGGVIVRPQIEQSFGFDSNVLGTAPAHGSWLIRTAPSVLVTSTGGRNPYGLYVSLDNTRYPGLPTQDRTDWTAAGGATLTIGEDHLTLGAAHLSLNQARFDLDALPTDKPVSFTVDDVRLGYASAFGRLTLEPSLMSPPGASAAQASEAFRSRSPTGTAT
jgi:Putative beta-barrel porin 2